MADQNIIAVSDISPECAGEITYWTLNRSTEIKVLRQNWIDSGFSEELLPSPPTPAEALKRAIQEHASGKEFIATQLETGSYEVGVRHLEADSTITESGFNKTVEDKRLFQIKAYKTQESKPALNIKTHIESHIKDLIIKSYASNLNQYSTTDISSFLVRMVKHNQSVHLRDTGGIYFVPKDNTSVWRKMSSVLGAAGAHRVFHIPALRGEETVQAVLASITAEAEQREQQLMDIVYNMDPEEVKKSSVARRAKQCDEFAEKIEYYGSILDTNLNNLRDKFLNIKAMLTGYYLRATTTQESLNI